MKITRVTIVGMHKVVQQSYDLNDLNYLFGMNGAGKSTVMQAIQLALLGYIPGTDKNKSAIFKHSNGNLMSVYIQFDDNTSILRKWENTGKDIKASVQFMPESLDIQSILAELELPIFNFNEFASMTANKLKEWFIKFLPECTVSIDLEAELRAAAPYADAIDPDFISDTVETVEGFGGSQIDVIRKFNDLCKQGISQYKAESTRLTDTMQSLVHYEDSTNVTIGVIEEDIRIADLKLQAIRNKIAVYQKNASTMKKVNSIMEVTGVHSNEEFGIKLDEYNNAIKECDDKFNEYTEEVTSLIDNIAQIKSEMASQEKILKGNGVCPYTSLRCDTISERLANIKSAYQTNQLCVADRTEVLAGYRSQADILNAEKQKLQSEANALASNYRTYLALYDTIDKSLIDTDISTMEAEEAELVAELNKLRDILVKKQANAQYEQLKDKIAKDSMQASQLLEVYKAWDKLSSVNGLQNKIMEAPFVTFSAQISSYLQQFFDDSTIEAAFHLGEKANSFSFGLIHNGTYIEYDLLSSGEKCLYTLALLIALVENSASPLKLIMIDDLLDHLDDGRITTCFATLYSCKNLQIIVAGVKPCKISTADEFVISIS